MLKRFAFRTAVLLTSLVVLVVAFVGLTIWRAGRGLPQWEGKVEVTGLDAPVEIVRDEHGIPYIRASSKRDLYFAQGFVHAQDRFWQMSLARRASAGRLAEWFGATALHVDRRARHLGVSQAAERSWAAFPEAERPLLAAYADGVNAWLESAAYRRPPEMVILHVDPEPWRPSDAFLVVWQLYETLATAGDEGLSEMAYINFRNPEAVDIFDTSDRAVPPIISFFERISVSQPTAPFEDKAFSDNWTLSGAHTASGLPLMANDPQLPATLPNFWHLEHHAAGDMAVAGGSVPGIPGIAVGHNRSLAWGETNALVDVRDYALLELRPDHPDQYRRGPDASWETFETRVETIRVRFGHDVVATVRFTPTGVIWPRDLLVLPLIDRDDVALERRDYGLGLPSTTPASILRLNAATTVEEALEAGEAFTGPPLNFSLADTQGSIGYLTGGRIPDRPEVHARTLGVGPDDSNAGTYLPYAENPKVVNPPGGRIVTANQRIIGDEYPHYLSDSWASPDRALRVHELLDMRETHDPESFLAMQMDALSPPARRLVPLLVRVEPRTEADWELVRILQRWDHRFTLESPGPTVFLTWVEMLNRRIIDDDLGSGSSSLATGGRALFTPVEQALSGQHPEWCDDLDTEGEESCPQVLAQALSDTRTALEEAFGPDPNRWEWGDVARIRMPHLGFATLPLLGGMFSRTTPLPGGPESLFQNGVKFDMAPRFSSTSVTSSYQAIYDLSDLEASEFMISGGESGHFRSPFYNNLTAGWIAGERIRIPSDLGKINKIATLSLVPPRRSTPSGPQE